MFSWACFSPSPQHWVVLPDWPCLDYKRQGDGHHIGSWPLSHSIGHSSTDQLDWPVGVRRRGGGSVMIFSVSFRYTRAQQDNSHVSACQLERSVHGSILLRGNSVATVTHVVFGCIKCFKMCAFLWQIWNLNPARNGSKSAVYILGVKGPLNPTCSLKSVHFLVITLSRLNAVCYHKELMALSAADCCRHHHCHLVNGGLWSACFKFNASLLLRHKNC